MKNNEDENTAAMAMIDPVLECRLRANALVSGALGRVMAQSRTVVTALEYVLALAPGTRANCWDLAEEAGHERPYRLHHLLGSSRWSWKELRGELAGLAGQVLPDSPADLIGPGVAIDETAHLKKGTSTACAAPQHAGVTGKVENCVTWVFAALVTACGQAWADFDMYMPKGWAGDLRRRRAAGIPDALAFATKPDLAIAQLKRLAAAGLRFCWVAADEVYGRSGAFRQACRELGKSYVVIIPCDCQVMLTSGKAIRADAAIAGAVFERRPCGYGTKGPRYSDWAIWQLTGEREFLLIRRIDRDKNQYTFYLCWAPEGRPATLPYFITIAGRRWPVESTFKTGKDTLGWDQSQARTYGAQCRHTALTALAQLRQHAVRGALAGQITLPEPAPADLTLATSITPAPATGPVNAADLDFRGPGNAPLPARAGLPCPQDITPIVLSVAEASRIERLAAAVHDGLLTLAGYAFGLRWSLWRRRHQARARWHHYSARLEPLTA